MLDNWARTICFTNHLRKLTDVVQARQDNPKPTHTHTQFCKHLMTHRGLQILPFVCIQMYVNSTMRAVLKNMSHPALVQKGRGHGGQKSPERLRLWNPVPAIINSSWVAKLDNCLKPTAAGSGNQGSGQGSGTQGSGNQGSGQGSRFRKPDFQARFWEQWVLATFWVPGRQGSGIARFSAPGRFRAHLAFDKVPGTLPWFRAVLESPEHQF